MSTSGLDATLGVERAIRALTRAAGLAVAVLLAGWLPHYLSWPWWPDLDAWATLAQGWDAGIRPYRDVTVFNFPGQIETAWLLGRAFGWGRTAPAYALDAALLVGLVAVLVAWSRRAFGRALPGLIGAAAALHYYARLDYALVAQRDWQAPLLALAGLLIVQAWPNRAGRVTAGALLGVALAIRPHAILFAPAHALAIADAAGRPRRRALRPLAEWAAATALLVGLAFLPLVAAGLLGDFVQGVRKASYGSNYSRTTVPGVFAGVLVSVGIDLPGPPDVPGGRLERLRAWTLGAVAVALGVLALRRDPEIRRMARAILAALVASLFYAPLHPKEHAYLMHPRNLAWTIALAALAGVLVARPSGAGGARPARARVRLIALAGLLALALPGVPRYWNPAASLRATEDLGRRGEPTAVPPGAANHWPPADTRSPYPWADYRAALDHLRRHTDERTLVANLLRNVPFPAVNGPVGRVSPLPGESGVIWLWSVEPELEPDYARAMAEAPAGTVAVWDPAVPSFTRRLDLPETSAVLRRLYRPEARFGPIEIWRKP